MTGVLNSLEHALKSSTQKGLPKLPALVTETDHGNLSPLSLAQLRRPKTPFFSLTMQSRRLAFALALASAGRSNPANMAMIAMTTNNSMSVKARGHCFVFIKKQLQKRLCSDTLLLGQTPGVSNIDLLHYRHVELLQDCRIQL